MDWHIAPHTRVDIVAFSGINFSGESKMVSIHPAGGRQGSSLKNFAFRSVIVAGPIGTQVVFRTSGLEDGWQERPLARHQRPKGPLLEDEDRQAGRAGARSRLVRQAERPADRSRLRAGLPDGQVGR